jgi:RING finger protein 170
MASLFFDLDESDLAIAAFVAVACAALVAAVLLVVRAALVIRQPPPAPPIDAEALRQAAEQMRRRRVVAQDGDADCVICLGPLARPMELLPCGHLFCEECLVAFVEARAFQSQCPTCRAPIELVAPCFRRFPPDEPPAQIAAALAEPLRRFNLAGRNGLTARGAYSALEYVMHNFFRLPLRLRLRLVAAFVGGVVYLLLPLDLIPESIFGVVGLVDDLFVVVLCAIVLIVLLRRAFAAPA